jgi:hypothetical protein
MKDEGSRMKNEGLFPLPTSAFILEYMRLPYSVWVVTALASLTIGCARAREPIVPLAAVTVAEESDSAVMANARAAADSFVRIWRYHWEVSESYRHMSLGDLPRPRGKQPFKRARLTWDPPLGTPEVLLSAEDSAIVDREWFVAPSALSRTQLLHCHQEDSGTRVGSASSGYTRIHAFIIEGNNKHAICPSWYPAVNDPPWDERNGIDHGLIDQLRPPVMAARADLLRILKRAASIYPDDPWVTGQLLRFSLDQGDLVSAMRILANCRAAGWWCSALTGYVSQRHGNTMQADSIFGAMLSQMPDSVACEWTDLTSILDDTARQYYGQIPCASRESVNATIWWLSDPLFTESSNERRAEHYARLVLLELLRGTGFHERWDLRPDFGGTAVAEMLLRYGWPSYSHWMGRSLDFSHYGYLAISDTAEWAHGRFASAEYTTPRFHTVPTWRAIVNPARAEITDWALSAAAHQAIYSADTLWWPREHYDRRAGPLVQLWSQYGMFRRDSSILLAVATNVVNELLTGLRGDTLVGALVVGASPDSMRGQPAGGVANGRAIARMMVDSRPSLASLELHSARTGASVRTRFGIEPPPPLISMKAGEVAISAPVLIRPPAPDEIPTSDPLRAISLMYGTLTFDSTARVGVYWETYGISSGDTVDIAIRIDKPVKPPGLLRRFAIRLGVSAPPTSGSGIRWREPQSGRAIHTVIGGVPVQGRNVTLDLKNLGVGDFTLTVSVGRPGEPPMTSQRDFWLVER